MLIYALKVVAFCPRLLPQILPAKFAHQFSQFPSCYSRSINTCIIFHFCFQQWPFSSKPCSQMSPFKEYQTRIKEPHPNPQCRSVLKACRTARLHGWDSPHQTFDVHTWVRHYSMLSQSIQRRNTFRMWFMWAAFDTCFDIRMRRFIQWKFPFLSIKYKGI